MKRVRPWLPIAGLLLVVAGLFMYWLAGPLGLAGRHVVWVRLLPGHATGADVPLVRFASTPEDKPALKQVEALLAGARPTPRLGLHASAEGPQLEVSLDGGSVVSFLPALHCTSGCQPDRELVLMKQGIRTRAVRAPQLAAYLAGDLAQGYPPVSPITVAPRHPVAPGFISVSGQSFTCGRIVLWLAQQHAAYLGASSPDLPPTPGAIRLAEVQPEGGRFFWQGNLYAVPEDYLIVAKGDQALDGTACAAQMQFWVEEAKKP